MSAVSRSIAAFLPQDTLYLFLIHDWEGQIQEDQEVILIAKTTEKNVPALKETVKAMHSYECPCIVCLPVTDGYEPFMQWIREQVI